MTCRQACNTGYHLPASEFLTQTIANDNRPAWRVPDWLASTFGICSCCIAQTVWSVFLVAQLSS